MEERNDNAKVLLTSNIRRFRKGLNMTQEKLAELSGLNSIADLEAGRSNPNLSTIIKIANSLGVEVWELFCNYSIHSDTDNSKTVTKQKIKDLVDLL